MIFKKASDTSLEITVPEVTIVERKLIRQKLDAARAEKQILIDQKNLEIDELKAILDEMDKLNIVEDVKPKEADAIVNDR